MTIRKKLEIEIMTVTDTELYINAARLRESIEKMSEIGATSGGGLHRLALSDEDRRARDLLVSWLEELQLEIAIDQMGNIFASRSGRRDDLPPVMTGSHLDSQPNGGRFDGTLGVLGALEVVRTLAEKRIPTERPIVIVNWTNEEGCRFAPAMIGSGVWSGALDQDWAYSRTDKDGKRFADELERIGYLGSEPAASQPLHAYFEYHIEQGPRLDKERKTVGAPEGIVGLYWFDVYIEGEANQVGPTPMEGRRDALCAAAEMILRVNELPEKMGGNMVATVGEIQNLPNSRNIIPGSVYFTVDIRSWDDELAMDAWQKLQGEFEGAAGSRGCRLRIEETWQVKHSPFDPKLVERVLQNAEQLGYPTLRMVSGAGHDASYVNSVAPTAMIFAPSIGGRSHVEVEDTKWEDCEAGANVLLRSVLQSANEL